MSEQSYYFLSTYNLLTAIYSRYLWTKVSPCGQGIRALCGRREIFVRTKIWRPADIMQKTKCANFRKRIAARWENETLQKNITNYKFIG